MRTLTRFVVVAGLLLAATASFAQNPPCADPDAALCMGDYDPNIDYCGLGDETDGVPRLTVVGTGLPVNADCWCHDAAGRGACTSGTCTFSGLPADNDFLLGCSVWTDWGSRAVCAAASSLQAGKQALGVCGSGPTNFCPTGGCLGCRGARSWCPCRDSTECPDRMCCSKYGNANPWVCTTVRENNGFGFAWDYRYERLVSGGQPSGNSFYDSCSSPDHTRPLTGSCGSYFVIGGPYGIEGLDYTLDHEYDGPCAHNPKKGCHWCKEDVFYEDRPTSCYRYPNH